MLKPAARTIAILSLLAAGLSGAPALGAEAPSQALVDHINAFQKDFAMLIERGQTALKASGAATEANDLPKACTLAKSSKADFVTLYDRTESIAREIEATGTDTTELKSSLPDIRSMIEQTDKVAQLVCSAAK
jgi:hypothetical protein